MDFSKGGIISEKEMRNLQQYLEFGRVRDAVTMSMANQITGFDGTTPITPFMAFPSETLPGGSWYTLILGPVMGFFETIGGLDIHFDSYLFDYETNFINYHLALYLQTYVPNSWVFKTIDVDIFWQNFSYKRI